MLSPAQTLNIDLGSSSQRLAANQPLDDGAPQFELEFDSLLQTSPGQDDTSTLALVGNELPLNGTTLPFAEGHDEANSADITGMSETGEQLELLLSVEPGIQESVTRSSLALSESPQAPSMMIAETAELGTLAEHRMVGGDTANRGEISRDSQPRPISPTASVSEVSAGLRVAIDGQRDQIRTSRARLDGAGTELQQQTDFQRDIPARIPGVPGLESPARQNFQRQLMQDGLENAEDFEGSRKIEKQLTSLSNSISPGGQSYVREATASGRPAHVVTTSIEQSVFDKSWGDALQGKVSWMTNRRIQSAEIRLNPAELGPIRIQVLVEDDAATLTFTAQHNLTRDAIEQALPRLREMLNDNGLVLAGSTVNDSADGELLRDDRTDDQPTSLNEQLTSTEDEHIETQLVQNVDSSALVDMFA